MAQDILLFTVGKKYIILTAPDRLYIGTCVACNALYGEFDDCSYLHSIDSSIQNGYHLSSPGFVIKESDYMVDRFHLPVRFLIQNVIASTEFQGFLPMGVKS